MTDPKRLVDEASGFEAELLRAGRKDELSAQSALAICAALGVAPPAAATSTLASGAKAASVKGAAVKGAAFKGTLALGSLGAAGALLWASVAVLSDADPMEVPQSRAQSHEQAPAVVVRDVPPIASVETKEATEATETARPKAIVRGARPTASSDADSLPRELEMIDRARSALARGEASRALSLLDAYSARFPKPKLRSESTVLRIEALVARGQGKAATRLGKQFLAREPNGPYARRVRSLLERVGAPAR